jgi:hypothetical protein
MEKSALVLLPPMPGEPILALSIDKLVERNDARFIG